MKFVAARWAWALLASPVVAQAPRGDATLNAYRDELVALRQGGLGLCGVGDVSQSLNGAQKRIRRIRDVLVVRYGEASIASEDEKAEEEFGDFFGLYDPIPCKRKTEDEEREARWSLARAHDRSLDILERRLGLAK